MLILPIKRKWLEMIRSGEKKEEYRSLSPYYAARFKKYLGWEFHPATQRQVEQAIRTAEAEEKEFRIHYPECDDNWNIEWGKGAAFNEIVLRAGYSLLSPAIEISGHITIGPGRQEWGAEEGKEYYILHIEEIMDLITDAKSYGRGSQRLEE